MTTYCNIYYLTFRSQLINYLEPQTQTYYDEGLQDFRDFVNFIDGVGLSAQWSPEFGFDWLQAGEQQQQQHQEFRRRSREPAEIQSPVPEDIGTPFSTWLPSAPADDQVQLWSHSGDGMSDLVKNNYIHCCDAGTDRPYQMPERSVVAAERIT